MTTATSSRNANLDLWFLNTAFANVGDASGLQPSATAGSLYIGLHTADPGIAGNQSTSEISYTNYLRVAVARSGSGWSRTLSVVSNFAAITFATCGAGGAQVATYFSVGLGSSGATAILVYGALTVSQSIAQNGTPSFSAGSLTVTWST